MYAFIHSLPLLSLLPSLHLLFSFSLLFSSLLLLFSRRRLFEMRGILCYHRCTVFCCLTNHSVVYKQRRWGKFPNLSMIISSLFPLLWIFSRKQSKYGNGEELQNTKVLLVQCFPLQQPSMHFIC